MKIKLLSEDATMPSYGSPEAAGLDLYASASYTIDPLEREKISTKVAISIPKGYYGRIAPRSGLAAKNGIDVLAGVVDSDYRGEIIVILYNTWKNQPFTIEKGDRIAQLVITPILRVHLEKVEDLEESVRGADGFGSTGI